MKAILLAGGLGTRISEESHLKPKPMIEIGGKPILWHIMKIYSEHGINDFIICCGYKSYVIKEYFTNYFLHMSDLTVDMTNNSLEVHEQNAEPWKVTLIETGLNTQTGGRLKRVSKYLEDDETFCLTYGDGVSNINISKSIEFHKEHGKLATMAAVQPPGRFGALKLVGKAITNFQEKPIGEGSWINGGFFVMSPKILDYIEDDKTILEGEPLQRLAQENELMAFKHNGFWKPMDTLRDKIQLEEMWKNNCAPWKSWS